MGWFKTVIGVVILLSCQSCLHESHWEDEAQDITLSETDKRVVIDLKDLNAVEYTQEWGYGAVCIISETPISYNQWCALNEYCYGNGIFTILPTDQEIEKAKEDIIKVPAYYDWLRFDVSGKTASFRVNADKVTESDVRTLYVATVLQGSTGSYAGGVGYVYIWKVTYQP